MSRGGMPWPKTVDRIRAQVAEDEATGATVRPLTKRQQIFLSKFKDILVVQKAAKAASIDGSNHYKWIKDSPGYRKHFLAIYDELAETAFAIGYSEAFNDGDPRGKEMFLRAFYPELFNPKKKLEMSGPDGGSIEMSHTSPPVAHIIQRLNALTERKNDGQVEEDAGRALPSEVSRDQNPRLLGGS
tara:strand:+ start:1232 stop:1789 length:558 start_codon:yes stop_codon:yes gene_type:complete